MSPGFAGRLTVLPILVVVLLPAASQAGDTSSQATFGSTFFTSSPPCPAKRFPTFESLVPIPAIVDPFEEDFVPIFCQVRTDGEQEPVKGVRGRFEAQVIVRDNSTGQFESFDVDSGAFKSSKKGLAEFDFELPTELFADGFESGDVSAWSYTRSDFSNKKKVGNASLQCGHSASRSD